MVDINNCCIFSQLHKNLYKEEQVMKPRITVITLGVEDLDRSLKFYRDGLGLPIQGIVGK